MKFVFSALIATLILCVFAGAQTTAFTYQGQMRDGAGLASGSYSMKFRLYDGPDAPANQIGPEIPVLVTVTNGLFSVSLDFTAASFPAGADRWIEVQVGTTTLTPRQKLSSTPFAVRAANANRSDAADSLSVTCASCISSAQIASLDASKINGSVAQADNATNAANAATAADSGKLGGVDASGYLQKSGGTMTGTLNLPANGLSVGTNQIAMSTSTFGSGNVMIGSGGTPNDFDGGWPVSFTTGEKFVVNGNITVPATSNYGYRTPKIYRQRLGPADFSSVNPSLYLSRIDDGFSSATVNGLNSLWATGGSAGTIAYFIAPVHLPDQSQITGLSAQLVKNGGSLQSIVELFRSDFTGYLSNTSQLIASASTTTSGGVVWTVNAPSVSTSFNVVDNTNYVYFVRWSGEQATQNVRLNAVTIIYRVMRAD